MATNNAGTSGTTWASSGKPSGSNTFDLPVQRVGDLAPDQRVPHDRSITTPQNPRVNEDVVDDVIPRKDESPGKPGVVPADDRSDKEQTGGPVVYPDMPGPSTSDESDAKAPGKPAGLAPIASPADTPRGSYAADSPTDPGYPKQTPAKRPPGKTRANPGTTGPQSPVPPVGSPAGGEVEEPEDPGYPKETAGHKPPGQTRADPGKTDVGMEDDQPTDPGYPDETASPAPRKPVRGDPGSTGPQGNPQPGVNLEDGDKPKAAMTIRGYAINTAHAGNGIHFRHPDVAALKDHESFSFVGDHDTGIGAVAGMTTFGDAIKLSGVPMSARRFSGEGDDGKPTFEEYFTREDAVMLPFTAELHANAPGYPKVAQSVSYLRSVGRVPNVSLFIKGTKLAYDGATDRLYMEGPYQVRHLGQVDRGAFSDEVGVGVYEVSMPMSESEQSTHSHYATVGVELCDIGEMASVLLSEDGLPEHVRAKLSEMQLKPLTTKARKALPKSKFAYVDESGKGHYPIHDESHIRNALSRAAQQVKAGGKGAEIAHKALPKIHAAAKAHGINVKNADDEGVVCGVCNDVHDVEIDAMHSELSYTEAEASHITDNFTVVSGVQNMTTPNPAAAGTAVSPLEARLARLEKERDEARAVALSQLRGAIASDYGVAAESIAVYQTVEQLEALRATLAAAKGNPLPRSAPGNPTARNTVAKRPHEVFAEDQFDAAEWKAWREGARGALLSGKAPQAVM